MDICNFPGNSEAEEEMVTETKIKKHLFITIAILLVAVFVAGTLLGISLSTSGVDTVTQLLKSNELNTDSYLIEQQLVETFGQESCTVANTRISEISDQLGSIGRELSAPGAKEQMGNDNFNYLKRKFHLMQIKNYILFKKFRTNCDSSPNVILYYYNINQTDSTKQGKILDQIAVDYKAHIFAIEYNYSQELEFLQDYYSINATPAIVVNYNTVHIGLTDYQTISNDLR